MGKKFDDEEDFECDDECGNCNGCSDEEADFDKTKEIEEHIKPLSDKLHKECERLGVPFYLIIGEYKKENQISCMSSCFIDGDIPPIRTAMFAGKNSSFVESAMVVATDFMDLMESLNDFKEEIAKLSDEDDEEGSSGRHN